MTDTFTCWKCRKEFPKAWSDNEAEAEYANLWGKHLGEAREILCDDYDKEFKKWWTGQL